MGLRGGWLLAQDNKVRTLLAGTCVFVLLAIGLPSWAVTADGDAVALPFSAVLTGIPRTTLNIFDTAVDHDTGPMWANVLVSTGVLYFYDEDILRETQHTGRSWGFSNEDRTKTVWKLGAYDLVRLPSDKQSALYFLGDGWVDIGIASTFLAYGHFGNHVRPFNTALELFHGLIVSAIFDQVLKRSFGRESPTDSSEPRGKWRPFPSSKAYGANTAKYDAMPSGHMMTSTLVFTIIRENYPEYDAYLLPLEIGWLSVLGFAMVNNGVHWASDYPLGMAIGYLIGKESARLANPSPPVARKGSDWLLVPGVSSEGISTLNAVCLF